MFRRVEVNFRLVELPAYVVRINEHVHRIIKLDNGEYLLITFDKDGSIFDVRKYKSFEFIRRMFERFGLYIECEPNTNNFTFEYVGSKKIDRKKEGYSYIRLPVDHVREVEIYKSPDGLFLLVPR